ncbi:EAL domain-containing protein [Rhizobium sp. BK176]|uniref:bifunctional diguanylate cyclase/phosphodiesterase n=1 Tax=Rhizobium sp. BK176 TaxID=2587071 RepID=UPI002166DD0C|nr:EAL domain-containing protein [Rhizobium sp. BK176]MCS4089712.1 diguanylate cyclase (GGDEF)-like protein [Rhizobium sp. BK176]
MINIISCLTHDHDPAYVLSALIVCAIGAGLTSYLFQKVVSSRDQVRKAALSIMTGMTAGSTVWTTHFVSMLGLRVSFPHSYAMTGTLFSLFLAMSLSSIAFLVAGMGRTCAPRLLGGTALGSGIAAMHYTGLSAFVFNGTSTYDPVAVVASCVLGTAFSISSIGYSCVFPNRYPRIMTAVLFVCAIASLHYVGMQSLTLTPGTGDVTGGGSTNSHDLFLGVMFVATMIMTFGIAAAILDTRSTNARLRDLEHRAYHDPLTGLPNRSRLDEQLSIHLAELEKGKLAVVAFDLNRFKEINDVHGHETGDGVLKTIAARLTDVLEEGEFVCRVGGDEFIAFRAGIGGRECAEAFAERLRSAVVADIDHDGKTLGVGSSLGVCIAPDDGTDARDLLIKADLAMYRAKRDRLANAMFYDFELDEENRYRSALAIDLRKAAENREFDLVYQPQNDIATGNVIGYEVLIRWNHPTRGAISPAVFIPIAERDGLITEIGDWVLRTACCEAATWETPVKIAVNVAARQLANDSFPETVRDALSQSGLDSSLLEIEITESGIVADADQARKIVKELKAIGVSIAMDDFGTGYSSLSTLQSFPFDKIKIDKTFVKNLTKSVQSQAIVKSTISLGRALNIDVLAEGVETAADLDFLRKEGCFQAQGFLFGTPLSSEMLMA